MQRILADISAYNKMQAQLDQDERDLTEHNFRMVEEIEKAQSGRDDDKEIQRFAQEQYQVYKKMLEDQDEEEKKQSQ